MWPIGLLQVSRVVDNPFSVAKSRADKAGQVLADALINRAQGERPVNLIGYSLGSRVIYSCLMTLAERKAFGLVDSVVLIGSPTPSQVSDWRAMKTVASGRLVNVFSENDYVLGFLYRTSSIQYGVAGLQKIEGVKGVENVDVSETISGHLRYRYTVGAILQEIGWEDLDEQGIKNEKEALEKMLAEQKKKTLTEQGKETGLMVAGFEKTGEKTEEPEAGEDGDGKKSAEAAEEQVQAMEKQVHDMTQVSLVQRGMQYIALHYGAGGQAAKAVGDVAAGKAPDASAAAGDAAKAAGAYSSYLPSMPSVMGGGKAGDGKAPDASQATDAATGRAGEATAQKSSGYASYLPSVPSVSVPSFGWGSSSSSSSQAKAPKEGQAQAEKAADGGKEAAGEAAGAVQDTAGATGQEQAEEAASSGKEAAGKAAGAVQDSAGKTGEKARKGASEVADAGTDAAGAPQEAPGKLAEGAQEAPAKLSETAQEGAGQVASKGQQGVSAAQEGAGQVAGSAQEGVGQATDAAKEGLGKVAGGKLPGL